MPRDTPILPPVARGDTVQLSRADYDRAREAIAQLEEQLKTAKAMGAYEAGLASGKGIAEIVTENTRLEKEVEQLKANERYMLDQRGALEQKFAAAVAENTPLRMRCADLADELTWLRRGGPTPLVHNHALEGPEMYVRNAPCPRCEQLKAILEKPSVPAPAVTGTTSDKTPFRQLGRCGVWRHGTIEDLPHPQRQTCHDWIALPAAGPETSTKGRK